jgi:TetR/AcrR family transcriptional regulator, cholesterol catabolism regulator
LAKRKKRTLDRFFGWRGVHVMGKGLIMDASKDEFRASKGDQTRARIITAMRSLAACKGTANVTLRDIAAEAGLKIGGIYFHFGSRDDIIRAVLKAGIDGAVASVRTALDNLPAEARACDRLEAALRAHVHYVVRERFAATLESIRALPQNVRDEHLADESRYLAQFQDLFDDALAEAAAPDGIDPHAAKMLLMGALTWVQEWYAADGRLTLDEIVDQLMLLCRGVFAVRRAK